MCIMDNFKRALSLKKLLNQKSYFLFGPRGTGKTSLIREELGNSQEYPLLNLLHSETRLNFLQNPQDLRKFVAGHPNAKAFVIDEVQKIPELLDEVHDLIESKKIKFLLTGSSARKLKRQSSNLLGGRARVAHFFPLIFKEQTDFNLEKRIQIGSLPAIWTSEDAWVDLRTYVDIYLKEEVQQEAQVRQLGQFARFLTGAALHSGDLLNYAAVASDAQVAESTVRSYYQILEDTLLGNLLEPFQKTKKRKAIQTGKFYLFDTGVTNAILNIKKIDHTSAMYGKVFEQLIYTELKAYLSYNKVDESLCFWRSVNKQEVDFLVGEHTAIEVKATKRVTSKDLSGLYALKEEKIFKNFYLISQDPLSREENGVRCLSFEKFLKVLWNGDLF